MRGRALATALTLGVCVGGCRGDDLPHDCDRQFEAFSEVVETHEQPLLTALPDTDAYPVALRITEAGLDRLLASVIDEGVPFGGTVPFGFLPTGPGDATFEAQNPPTIELADVPGCPTCIVFNLEFGVRVASTTSGEALSSGPGFAKLAIPLRLEPDLASGTSTLLADYDRARILDWSLSVYGFDSEVHTMLAGALRVLLEEEIASAYAPFELMRLGSWSFGSGAVLLASQLEVRPDTRELVLGMQTNLPLDENVRVSLDEPLPADAPLGIAFDTRLLLAMTQHLFAQGQIPRRYDEEGRVDGDGLYGVTMEALATRPTPSQALDARFRVWRVDAGYCGFATAQMPLRLQPRTRGAGASVVPGVTSLVEDGPAQGVGAEALEEERLVEDNQALVASFRDALAEQLANTLNYEQIELEGSQVFFTTQGVVAADDAVSLHLDFLVVAQP